MLWKAEALIETGKVSDAIDIINEVRERARNTVGVDGETKAPAGTLPDRDRLGSKEQAWEYIEQASTLCSEILRTPEEIDKSFLIGGAMKSNKIEDWEELILCYSLLRNSGE